MNKKWFWISGLLLPLVFVIVSLLEQGFHISLFELGNILTLIIFLIIYSYAGYKTIKTEKFGKSALYIFFILLLNIIISYVLFYIGHAAFSQFYWKYLNEDFGGDMSGLIIILGPLLLGIIVVISGIISIIINAVKKHKK